MFVNDLILTYTLILHHTYIQVDGDFLHYEQFVHNSCNNTSKFRLCVAKSGNNNAFVHNGFQMQNLSVKLSGLWWTCPEVQLSKHSYASLS